MRDVGKKPGGKDYPVMTFSVLIAHQRDRWFPKCCRLSIPLFELAQALLISRAIEMVQLTTDGAQKNDKTKWIHAD